jgi:glycosyltransferase involved in cell wall biosynthesis
VPFLPFYNETVMISKRRIEDHIRLYRHWGIPGHYDRRIRYICNGISLPEIQPAAKTGIPQKLLFVGRGTPEKRPALAAALATGLEQKGLPIKMGFVGDVSGAVDPSAYPRFSFYGNVEDPARLDQLYSEEADILLVTSSEEGFPLVIMEAMARGVVIMATPVGDIPVHIQTQENGWVFTTVHDEKAMLAEAAAFMLSMQNDPEKYHAMSARNISYAYENFGLPTFVQQYRTLIENHLR